MKYRGQRWVRIGVRTTHLLSGMFLAGAVLGQGVVGEDSLTILVLSGAALVADDFVRYGFDTVRWLAFWSVAAKVGLLGFGVSHPAWMPAALVACVVIGGVVSHAPGAVRHWPLVGGPGPCASKARS